MKNNDVLLETNLIGYGERRQGKVRDIYDLGEHLLLVVSDRISAFDVILPNGIPGKGAVLTKISRFWFRKMEDIIPNHRDETAENGPFMYALFDEHPELAERTMLVKKATLLPVECIVRGYLSGGGWESYQKYGTICGISIRKGLRESEKLDEPIFTPSTKAEEGHDINITFNKMIAVLCGFWKKRLKDHSAVLNKAIETAQKIREVSLAIYKAGSKHAESKNIIIADTKMEFGLLNGEIILIDELLTPDSSRFWPMEKYAPGRGQDSYDKQPVRDYLLTLDWDKTYPGPMLPDYIVEKTAERYRNILKILTS